MPFLAETQACADEVSEVTIIQKSAREHFGTLFRCVTDETNIGELGCSLTPERLQGNFPIGKLYVSCPFF